MHGWYEKKKELITSKTVTRLLPANYTDADQTLFSGALKDNFRSVNMYYVKDAYILKDTLVKKFRFLDSFTHVRGLTAKRKIKRLSLLLLKGKKIQKGAWLINDWSVGYFHWFIDVLPKLTVSEEFIKEYKLLIPAQYRNFKYIGRSLDRLGVNYIYYDDTRKIKVGELIVVDLLRYCDVEVMNKLRNKFQYLTTETGASYKKIYISRSKAPKRKILNETEVRELMLSFGFEIHCFEDYDLDKAIEIMQQCKYLVSIHGAGLTNMLFMKNGTKILELRQEGDSVNGCYYSMANALDIDYYYLLCKSTGGEIQVADLTVDIEKLKLTLKQMLQ